MAATPQFVKTPVIGATTISTANTNRNGTGTISTLLTGGTNGTSVKRVKAIATGVTTAGFVRLFTHDGTNAYLLAEIQVTAITPSASVAAWNGELELFDYVLPNGWSIRVSTHNGEEFDVQAFGGNF